ncbi:serine/threonine-protein phosphatase family [Grosmannia clavigera kw1407]|uniref:Serine/threonine-protein phosphatase family n=1 Tax=Grosmannia clavigera (strain kw1407 / UAMH 11150) TaxID=655863 RepID=F0XTA7_GROCL|nr:serine/threonine-protein phosphatase family [Grosmannia clavigera kw1407]EFW99103.1 serine/threonine-protein phosphatase family [Grosmannia clavigera kw1407]
MAFSKAAASAVAVGLAAFAPLTQAMQPSAAFPVPAPMRPLQWGDINFLHTTDTHGWHGGHLQESQYSADWGDYVSFAEHLRRHADNEGVDLLLVDTGDRVEGNGLYDGSQPKGQYTYDIFKEQHMDIICTGNHELYQADTAEREHEQTVPNFRGKYLASNLDYIEPATGELQAMSPQRYRAFQTKNRKINVVAFGFLFDFTGNANNTVVQPVRQTVREPWFQQAIRDEPAELFVVIGHVGVRMAELQVIYEAIREQNPDTPIAIFGGHAHVRDAVRFDDKAFAIASGRYFETIGWMSVSSVQEPKTTFRRRYIDNNLLGLYYHSGLNASTFPTEHGLNVSALITDARADLQLDSRFGCAPKNYWMQRRPHTSPDSVYTLLRDRVLPEAIVRPDRAHVPRLVLTNTGAIRFDIFKGAFTRDTTFIVSPFVNLIYFIPDVPYALAKQVLGILNRQDRILAEKTGDVSLDWRELNVPEQYAMKGRRHAAAVDEDGADRQKLLGGEESYPRLVAGYTTWDDAGTDGDDAIHSPLPFHPVPNCIQAEAAFPAEGEPETVDLVFFDFVGKFVLQALAIAGHDSTADSSKHYTETDTETYLEGKFTDYFNGWIKENWGQHC